MPSFKNRHMNTHYENLKTDLPSLCKLIYLKWLYLYWNMAFDLGWWLKVWHCGHVQHPAVDCMQAYTGIRSALMWVLMFHQGDLLCADHWDSLSFFPRADFQYIQWEKIHDVLCNIGSTFRCYVRVVYYIISTYYTLNYQLVNGLS